MANCQRGVIGRSGVRGRQGPFTPNPLPAGEGVRAGERLTYYASVGVTARVRISPNSFFSFFQDSPPSVLIDVAIEARRSDHVGPLRVCREPVDDRVRLYGQLDGLPRYHRP